MRLSGFRALWLPLALSAVKGAETSGDSTNTPTSISTDTGLREALEYDHFSGSLDDFGAHALSLIGELKQEVISTKLSEPVEILGDVLIELQQLRDTNFEKLNDKLADVRKRRDQLKDLILDHDASTGEERKKLLRDLRNHWNLFVRQRSALAAEIEDAVVESLRVAGHKAEEALLEKTPWETVPEMIELRLSHFVKVFRKRARLIKMEIEEALDSGDGGEAAALDAAAKLDLFRRQMEGRLEHLREKLDLLREKKGRSIPTEDKMALALMDFDYEFEKRNIVDLYQVLLHETKRMYLALVPGVHEEYVAQEDGAMSAVSAAVRRWRQTVKEARSKVNEIQVTLEDSREIKHANLDELASIRRVVEHAEDAVIDVIRGAESDLNMAREKALELVQSYSAVSEDSKLEMVTFLSQPPLLFELLQTRAFDELSRSMEEFKQLQHWRDMEVRKGYLLGKFRAMARDGGMGTQVPSLEEWRQETGEVERMIRGEEVESGRPVGERMRLVQRLESAVEKLGVVKEELVNQVDEFVRFLRTLQDDEQWVALNGFEVRMREALSSRREALQRRRSANEVGSDEQLQKRAVEAEGDQGAPGQSSEASDAGGEEKKKALEAQLALAQSVRQQVLEDYARLLALNLAQAYAIRAAVPDIPAVDDEVEAFSTHLEALEQQNLSASATSGVTLTKAQVRERVAQVEARVKEGMEMQSQVLRRLSEAYRVAQLARDVKTSMVRESELDPLEQDRVVGEMDREWKAFERVHEEKVAKVVMGAREYRARAMEYVQALSRSLDKASAWEVRYRMKLERIRDVTGAYQTQLRRGLERLQQYQVTSVDLDDDSVKERQRKEEQVLATVSEVQEAMSSHVRSVINEDWQGLARVKDVALAEAKNTDRHEDVLELERQWNNLLHARTEAFNLSDQGLSEFSSAAAQVLEALRKPPAAAMSVRVQEDLAPFVAFGTSGDDVVQGGVGQDIPEDAIVTQRVVRGFARAFEGQCQAEFVIAMPIQDSATATTSTSTPPVLVSLSKPRLAQVYLRAKLRLLNLLRHRTLVTQSLEHGRVRQDRVERLNAGYERAFNGTAVLV